MSVGTPDGSIEQANIRAFWRKYQGNLEIPQAPQIDSSRPGTYEKELKESMDAYFKYFMPYVTRIQ